MDFTFTYMGTKRQIADRVAEVLDRAPPGPCLDLFAGMSAVGRATSDCRNVWCNDVQSFAATAARSFFTALKGPKIHSAFFAMVYDAFLENRSVLDKKFRVELEDEANSINSYNLYLLTKASDSLIKYCISDEARDLRKSYADNIIQFPSCLFTITYSGGFIGIRQAIDIDSIRYSIDHLLKNSVIDEESHRWYVVALCYVLANISNSTGHFAQYLSVKENTKARYIAKRRRDVWKIWHTTLNNMKPIGTQKWRRRNRVFKSEATELLRSLKSEKSQPAVIYADPPYTADHYSRYYHLWDTLVLYDYPVTTSKAQYRSNRFCSQFSTKTQALTAFEALIESAAKLNSALVLSYPENWLLTDSTASLNSLLRANFRFAEVAAEISHVHSTLGASKGTEKAAVTERIFFAHN